MAKIRPGLQVSRQGKFWTKQEPLEEPAALDVSEPAPAAWVILGSGWEHNDEFMYEVGGQFLEKHVYFDKALADAECARLNTDFYEASTPTSFELNIDNVFEDAWLEEHEDEEITWAHVREHGYWQDPFIVVGLTTPPQEHQHDTS